MSPKCSAKKGVLAKHFVGKPKPDDIKIVEDVLPCQTMLADGEFLVEVLHISLDPYVRPYSRQMKEGDVIMGMGIGRVIHSKNDAFPSLSHVCGPFGWRTHALTNGFGVTLISNADNLPLSYYLGILGTTGLTAYFGMKHVCCPKPGNHILINAAAGAVGLVAGQIGKVLGCIVIGSTGSDKKVEHLKERGFDKAFNYKSCQSIEKALQECCPKGIDCFFDNVGGHFFDEAMKLMNSRGRVALSGALSMYNADGNTSTPKGPYIHDTMIAKDLRVEGFNVARFNHQFDEAIVELKGWIKQGALSADEHIVHGFDNIANAFCMLMDGVNIGKMIVSTKT